MAHVLITISTAQLLSNFWSEQKMPSNKKNLPQPRHNTSSEPRKKPSDILGYFPLKYWLINMDSETLVYEKIIKNPYINGWDFIPNIYTKQQNGALFSLLIYAVRDFQAFALAKLQYFTNLDFSEIRGPISPTKPPFGGFFGRVRSL